MLNEFYKGTSSKYLTLGILNIDVKNNEAIHDALIYFDKKCPYCGDDLFQTTKRKQFEIDHFFPVEKGGQDLPWNILPVCYTCNRKKKNSLPHLFLEENAFKKVSSYLQMVYNKYKEESIDSYFFKEKLTELINKEINFIKNNIHTNFISTLLYLADQQNIINNIDRFGNKNIQLSKIDSNAKLIIDYLNKKIPSNWDKLNITQRIAFLNNNNENQEDLTERQTVCIAEIWCECLGKSRKDINRYDTREINDLMKKLDTWHRSNKTKNFSIYGIQRYYYRIA